MNLPLPLYTTEQARQLDRFAICEGVSAYTLMQRAAKAAWNVFSQCWCAAQTVAVVCGSGNNGGDGYEWAWLAKEHGLVVTVYDIAPHVYADRSVEAQRARQQWIEAGGKIAPIPSVLTEEVIIDALLGTGLRLPLAPAWQQAIEAIHRSQKPVLSLDIPSGLQADTGVVEEPVVHATVTVTFIGIKVGLVMHQGTEVVGALYYDDLGVKTTAPLEPIAQRIEYDKVIHYLAPRRLSSHKGDHGHVFVIGAGSVHYGGAVCLAGEAALRAGAGVVSMVVAPESIVRVAQAPVELMIAPEGKWERASVLLLGPGLSNNAWAEKIFHEVMTYGTTTSLPMVIDADGLNGLAQSSFVVPHAILTPHPGEAARLLQTSIESIQQNRIASAKALQTKYGGVIVLKGAGTVVVDQQQRVSIMAGGYPALATAGTGDVLAGIISALLAQGLSLENAAIVGVCVHALASAEQAKHGSRGMMASDLFADVRRLLNKDTS